ncbi:hypothetical protein, partial [Kandleria vitulina]|uniref:hypothetical protein n=1 Tax=Kandleria vitulina TaxID=1630 RepID=UPI0033246C3A
HKTNLHQPPNCEATIFLVSSISMFPNFPDVASSGSLIIPKPSFFVFSPKTFSMSPTPLFFIYRNFSASSIFTTLAGLPTTTA